MVACDTPAADAREQTAEALVALGTNVAFRGLSGAALLACAAEALGHLGLITLRRSSFWLSPAWPDPRDPPFVNACLAVQPSPGWPAAQLMEALHQVEAQFGRVRAARNAPRTLDLDLIAWGERVIDQEGLRLPHPRLRERAFVLAPLQEIAPEWRHPQTQEPVAALLAAAPGLAALQRLGPWEAGSI